MAELIAKLEAAEAGSRELDAEIAVAVRATETAGDKALPDWADRNFPTWRARADGKVEVVHKDGIGGLSWSPLHYTTSLDAALILVPEGWFPSMVQGHDFLWLVEIQTANSEDPTHEATRMQSHALALCIAALKARAGATKLSATPESRA